MALLALRALLVSLVLLVSPELMVYLVELALSALLVSLVLTERMVLTVSLVQTVLMVQWDPKAPPVRSAFLDLLAQWVLQPNKAHRVLQALLAPLDLPALTERTEKMVLKVKQVTRDLKEKTELLAEWVSQA